MGEYERRLEENPDDPGTPPWQPGDVIAEHQSAGSFEGFARDSDHANSLDDDESGPFSDRGDDDVDEGLFSGSAHRGEVEDREDSHSEHEAGGDETESNEDGADED